jgi:two-component system cell cycle sensor histidine kinase PleC
MAASLTPPETDVPATRDLVTHATWVTGDTPVASVIELFERSKDIDSVAVLDPAFVGMVSRLRFFARIGRRFGYSLYENRPVRLLAEEGSVIDASADPVEAIALATMRGADRVYDDLLVVEDGRFVGIVSMRALLVHHKNLLSASLAEVAALDTRNRELERLHRLQADFVARMTHELRSPLNTILGIVHLLLGDKAVAERHARNLDLILARGRDLRGVIDNVLDFSRMEAGAIKPIVEPVDLPALFEDMALSTEALVRGRPVRVVLETRSLARGFATDPSFLRRILTNLLANAAAATEMGEIRLRAECAARWLQVQVADTGHGIPADALPDLFQAFSQIEPSITRRRGGSGLGLAIVRGLLEELGGNISVESRESEGTTFSFGLPSSPVPHGAAHHDRPSA